MKNFSEFYKIMHERYLSLSASDVHGKSKIGLARCLGISQGRMQHWEKGQWPSAADCWNISQKLEIRLEWIVTGEGPMLATDSEPPAPNHPHIDEELLLQMSDLLEDFLKSAGKDLSFRDKVNAVRQLYELAMQHHNGELSDPIDAIRIINRALTKAETE